MKKTKYPKTIKLGVTAAQSAWIKREAAKRPASEAEVIRSAVDLARNAVKMGA